MTQKQKRRCRDDGVCHHNCKEGECFREQCCEPFSSYTGPWGSGRYVMADGATASHFVAGDVHG